MAKLEIGVLAHLSRQPEDELKKVVNLGLRSCQVCSWEAELWTADIGKRLASAAKSLGVTISTFAGRDNPPANVEFHGRPEDHRPAAASVARRSR